MKIFDFVTGLFDPVTNLVDEIFTSKEEKNNFKVKLEEIKQAQFDRAMDFQRELMNQQANVIMGEVSGNWLQRSWRPILMLSFGFIIVYQFFIAHFLDFWFEMPEFEIPDQFWTLLEIGIGGYVAARSIEKVAPKIVEGNTRKKEAEAKVEALTNEIQSMKTEDLSARDMKKLARLKKREERFQRGKERRDKRRQARENN